MGAEELDEVRNAQEEDVQDIDAQEYDDDIEGEEPEEDDGEIIALDMEDENGERVTQEFTAKELRQIVSGYKKSQESPINEEVLAQVGPYMDRVSRSALLQWVNYYQDQGMNDEQVLQQLWKEMNKRGMGPAEQEEEENPPVDKEEYNWIKKKVYEEHVKPLQQELEQIKQQQMYGYIQNNNTQAFSQALRIHGWDESRLSKEQVNQVYKTLNTMYPNVNIQNYGLTQEQANMIIKSSLGQRRTQKQKQQINSANITKQANLPRMMPGSAGKNYGNTTPTLPIDNMSLGQRITQKKKLFS